MPEPRDRWGKLEVVAGAVGALGSIAIPIALFVVGNRVNQRQQMDADRQLQADRVEKMIGHLASDNADERKLAVSTIEFFVSEDELPKDLLPLLLEVARSDSREDVADSAAGIVQQVEQSRHADVAAQARKGLSAMPLRVNVHPSATSSEKADTVLTELAHDDVVVSPQQQGPEAAVGATELRYFRKEDADAAHKVARSLALKGITAEVKDWTQRVGRAPMRPKSLDLVFGK